MSSERVQRLSQEIAEARDYVLGIVSGLTPEQFERPTINEGWSVKDVMCHLSTIPMRNIEMWKHALEDRAWTGEAKVDDFSARMVEERKGWTGQQIVDEYKQGTADQIAFLGNLSDADLDKEWDHPAASIGRASLASIAGSGPRHHRKHADEIKAAVN
jgi:Mycothiol maleylpyruvate isomerase N-terminal domain